MKMFCRFKIGLITLFSTSIASAEHVLFYIRRDVNLKPRPVSSPAHEVSADGSIRVHVTTYYESTFQTDFYFIPESSALKEVSNYGGFQRKDVVCLKVNTSGGRAGTDVEIQHLYPNGIAEVHFGDFFGQRVSIFRRSEILHISQLQGCNLSSK